MTSLPQPKTIHTQQTARFDRESMPEVMAALQQNRMTGSLTLHFNQGRVQILEWTDGKKVLDETGLLCSKLG